MVNAVGYGNLGRERGGDRHYAASPKPYSQEHRAASSHSIHSHSRSAVAIAPPYNHLAPTPHAQPAILSPAAQVAWSVPHPQPGCHVFRSLEEMAQIWLLHGGSARTLPAVNFQESMVLAVFAGEGYSRESLMIQRLKPMDDQLHVFVCAYTRPWQTHNPMSVVRVPWSEQPIRFVRLS